MTELNNLLLEFARRINSHSMNGLSESDNKFLVEDLNKKYSVTLRNSNSSADNTSDEQLHSDEVLMSKIEDMIDLITNRMLDNSNRDNIEECYKLSELFDQFKSHRNTVSKPVKQEDDNLVDEDELTEQIETMLFSLSTTMIDDYYGNEVIAISGKNKVAKEIAKLFKTYQNSVLRPVKD